MILSTMLMDSARVTEQEVEAMLQPLAYYRLVDEFVYNYSPRSVSVFSWWVNQSLIFIEEEHEHQF